MAQSIERFELVFVLLLYMNRLACFLLLFAVTNAGFGQEQRIWFPSEQALIFKLGIGSIEAWRTDRKTGKRNLETTFTIDTATRHITEHTYFDFFDKPTHRFKEEKWTSDFKINTYTNLEYDSLNQEHLIERKVDYYNADNQLVKRVVESNPGPYFNFTQIIDPEHPGYQNNVLVKVRVPADTFQYIVNKQNENTHHYYIKDKTNDGNWVITEESFTGYTNGEFSSYENYRNAQLINKYNATTFERKSDTVTTLNLDEEFFNRLPHHEHPTPSDTTYSLEASFKTKKKIEKKRSSPKQYQRIRLYMDEDHDMLIEEWIYDPRGLTIKMDISYQEYVVEYIYK